MQSVSDGAFKNILTLAQVEEPTAFYKIVPSHLLSPTRGMFFPPDLRSAVLLSKKDELKSSAYFYCLPKSHGNHS